MSAGRFISLEGGEGCGKSTQARLLFDWLEGMGIPVVLTREPGGTPGAEAIRQLLLKPPEGTRWGSAAEALLFAAARSDHVNQVISPALAAGQWVICDRFVDSSFAYQAMAGGLGLEKVSAMHTLGSGGLLPDRTILLQISQDDTAARLRKRDGIVRDAIAGRGEGYHDKVAEAFATLAQAEPSRFTVVDATGEMDAVHKRVCAAMQPLLGRIEE